jgi:hypothetical protein
MSKVADFLTMARMEMIISKRIRRVVPELALAAVTCAGAAAILSKTEAAGNAVAYLKTLK